MLPAAELPPRICAQVRSFAESDLLAGDQTTVDSLPERLPDEISLYVHASISNRPQRALKIEAFTVRLNHNTIL
jgi:hypothetical protein